MIKIILFELTRILMRYAFQDELSEEGAQEAVQSTPLF